MVGGVITQPILQGFPLYTGYLLLVDELDLHLLSVPFATIGPPVAEVEDTRCRIPGAGVSSPVHPLEDASTSSAQIAPAGGTS